MLDARYNDKSEFLVWILPWILRFTQIAALTPPPCPVDLTEAALMLPVPGSIPKSNTRACGHPRSHQLCKKASMRVLDILCPHNPLSIVCIKMVPLYFHHRVAKCKDCACYQQLFNKYVIQSWNIGWFLILITRWLFREIRSDLIWSHFIWFDLISSHLISSDFIWFLFFSTRSKAYSILVRLVRCGKHARFIELWRLRWHKQTHVWLEKSLRGFFPLIENI